MTVLLATAVVALSGCSLNKSIPHTTITGKIGNSPFSLETPKNCDLAGLDVSADTNGTVHLKLDKLTTKMDAEVITNSGQAQSAIIAATADAVTKGISAGAAAAGSAMGAAVKTP